MYESILDLILFLVLLFVLKKGWNKKDGNIALLYLISYSLIRIFVEYFRIDSVMYIHGLPVAMVVSLAIIIVAIIAIICNNLPKEA